MKNVLVLVLCMVTGLCYGQQKKIDYQLIKRADKSGWYSAIVREINPAKDDYKAYCRYIVADAEKKIGNDQFVICIYDSKKARDIYDITYTKRILSKDERNYMYTHTVALYSGKMPVDGMDYELSFYTDCVGTDKAKYRGREVFKP